MKHESLDTNVLLRLMLDDVPAQTNRADKLLSTSFVRFFISDLALFEFVYVLDHHYKLSRQTISEMVQGLLSIKKLDCNRELITSALVSFNKHFALSFADCYLAASATFMNATPLWTFDKALAKQIPDVQLLQ